MTRVLLQGRLRVDAQRAASKLRDYLLSDPSTWLCEVVRTASMSGATRVEVHYDSDDVWVTFDGAAWPSGFLETAAGDLGVADDRQETALERRLRLFTLAMFAALGDEAEAVEVFVRDSHGAVFPARIEAAGLADPSRPRGKPRPAPKANRNVTSITAHVERPTSLRTLKRLVTSAAPPEVPRLRERWSTRSVPVHVNGVALVDATPAATWTFEVLGLQSGTVPGLLRLEYSPAALELCMHFYERGVLLAVEAATLPGGMPIRLPFILRSDADAVPCNISRSRVQADHVRAVLDHAIASLTDAARVLVFERTNADDPGRRSELREIVGRLAWAVATQPELVSLAFLLEVPLLLDVWGCSHSLANLFELHRSATPLYVCKNDHAIAPEVRLLVPHLFRAGPFTLDRMAFATNARPYEEIADAVAAGMKRRERVLERPAAPFELPHDRSQFLRTSRELHGAKVHIGLRGSDGGEQSANVRFYVDGQVIETARVPLPQGALPFDALVAAPSTLQLNPSYDGYTRNQAFHGFMLDLMTAATTLLLHHNSEVPHDRLSDVSTVLARVLRIPGHALEPLKIWRVWRAVTGLPTEAASTLSTEEICTAAKQDLVVRFVSPEIAARLGPQPAPLLVLDARQASSLAALLSPAELQNHDAWAQRPRTSTETLFRAARECAHPDAFAFALQDHLDRVAVSFGHLTLVIRVRRNVIVHAGPPPEGSVLTRLDGLIVAVEEDAWMPGFAVLDRSQPPRLPALVEQVAERLVQTLLESTDTARLLRSREHRRLARAALHEVELKGDRRLSLRELPMFELYDDGAPRPGTIAELCLKNPSEIPFFRTLPVEPVQSLGLLEPTEEDLALVRRLSGRDSRPWRGVRAETPSSKTTHEPPFGADTRFAVFQHQDADLAMELWPAKDAPNETPSLKLEVVHADGVTTSLVIESVRFAIAGRVDTKDGLVTGSGELRQRVKAAVEERLPAFGAHLLAARFNPFESANAIATLATLVFQGKLARDALLGSTHVVLTLMGWVPFRDYARGVVDDAAVYELGPMDPRAAAELVNLTEALGMPVLPKPIRSAPTEWTVPTLTIHEASAAGSPGASAPPAVDLQEVPAELQFPVPSWEPPAPPTPLAVNPPSPLDELSELLRQSPIYWMQVVSSTEGPSIRFDRDQSEIVVNVESPQVGILLERKDLVSLAAAAISEAARDSSTTSTIAPDEHARWLVEALLSA